MHRLRKTLAREADDSIETLLPEKRKKADKKGKGLTGATISRKEKRQTHQRNEDRFPATNETARASWRDTVCDVRVVNYSSNGIQIETALDADIGETIQVELGGCDPVPCSVRWICDERKGLEFAGETQLLADAGVVEFVLDNVADALEAAGEDVADRVGVERRGIAARHSMVWLATLRHGKTSATTRLRNISSTGAMVHWSGDANFAVGKDVTLDLGGAGSHKGAVRWIAGHEAGIDFAEPFDLELLAGQRAAHVDLVTQEEVETEGYFERIGKAMERYREPEAFTPVTEESARLTLDEVWSTLYPNGRLGEENTEDA